MKPWLPLSLAICLLFPWRSLPAQDDKQRHEVIEAWELANHMQLTAVIGPSLTQSYAIAFWKFQDVRVTRVILDIIGDAPPLVQHYLIRKLGDLKQEQAVARLIAFTNAQNPWWVRSVALEALGKIGHPSAVKTLSLALDDPEPVIQRRAIESLHKIVPDGPPFSAANLAEITDTWKIWAREKSELYATMAPADNFPYWDPLTNFELRRPAGWAIEAMVGKSLGFAAFAPEPDSHLRWRVWGLKLGNDSDFMNSPEFGKLEMEIAIQLRQFRRVSARTFRYQKWVGHKVCYQGHDKQGALQEYILVFFLGSGGQVYCFLSSYRPDLADKVIKYLEPLLDHFRMG